MSDLFDLQCSGNAPEGTTVQVGQLWTMAGELYLVVGLSSEVISTKYEKNRTMMFAELYHSDGMEMRVSVSLLDGLLGERVQV